MTDWLPTLARPAALWLLPALLALLIFLRFFQTRRRDLLTGSLMLWRRLAAQQAKIPPRRVLIDRTLLAQCAILACLAGALAGPSLALGRGGRSALVLMIDNGPQARARLDGREGLARLKEQARELLARLDPGCEIILCRAAPFPALLAEKPLSRANALQQIELLQACVSGPAPDAVWLFAADQARASATSNASALPVAVVSLQDGPQGTQNRWLCAAPPERNFRNAGIVAFGSAEVDNPNPQAAGGDAEQKGARIQLLARVGNFGTQEARGKVVLSAVGSGREIASRGVKIGARGSEAIVFSVPKTSTEALRLQWLDSAGGDALPEDDSVVAVPRRADAVRVRFHAPLPALEALYRAMHAVILPRDDDRAADLEIYVRSLPEQPPPGARAILLVAPPSGYRGIFDVGPRPLEHTLAQRDEDDPLTRFIGDRPESSFQTGRALEILRTGDFRSLIKDQASGRTLVARFQDDGRQGYLLAFIPGAGMPEARRLEPPLAALLVRMARQAAGLGDPYMAAALGAWELQHGRALPQDWMQLPEVRQSGGGVLDESVSGLKFGTGATGAELLPAALAAGDREIDLAPWLALLALALIVVEAWLQGSSVRISAGRYETAPYADSGAGLRPPY